MKSTAIFLISFLTLASVAYGQDSNQQKSPQQVCQEEINKAENRSKFRFLRDSSCDDGQEITVNNIRYCVTDPGLAAILTGSCGAGGSSDNQDKQSCDEAAKEFRDSKKNYSEDLKGAVDDLLKEQRDLQEKINELQEDVEKHRADMDAIRMQLNTDLEAIEAKRQKYFDLLKSGTTRQTEELSRAYDEINTNISRLLDEREMAELELTRQYKAAEGECVAQAKQSLLEYLNARNNKLQNSNLSARSTRALFSKSGYNVESEHASLAYSQYLQCIRGKSHRDKIELIERQRAANLRRIANAIEAGRAEQAKLILRMTDTNQRTVNVEGLQEICGGKTIEQCLTAINTEVERESRQKQSIAQQKMRDLENKFNAALRLGQEKGKRLKAVRNAIRDSRKEALNRAQDDDDEISPDTAAVFPTLRGIIGDSETVIEACKCNQTAINSGYCEDAKRFRCAGDIMGIAGDEPCPIGGNHRNYENRKGINEITR